MGSIGGFGFGLLLFNACFYLTDSYIALWCVTLGCAVINGLITLYQSEHLLIHSTSIFGTYFIVNGVGALAGSY